MKKSWYSRKYKEKYDKHFSDTEAKREIKEEARKNLEKIRQHRTFLDELEKEYRELGDFVRKPRYVNFFKFLVIFIVVLLIGYIIYSNFLVSKDFEYYYDIGSDDDWLNPYLTPPERVSNTFSYSDGTNYRNLTGHLIYFEVPVPRNSESVFITTRFMDNFPESESLSIGARDKEEWHYTYNQIFIQEEPNSTNEWITKSTQFDFERNLLFVDDNKLSMFLSAPHLTEDRNQTNTQYIPVDWIKITVHKPGLLERYEIYTWSDIPNLWR